MIAVPTFLRRLPTATLALVQLVVGCATVPAGPPPTHTARVVIPNATPLPQTQELQRRGGISIMVAPAPVSVQSAQRCEYSASRTLVLMVPSGVSRETHALVDELRFPSLRTSSDDVEFLVNVTNHMDRVFRGAGTVVQYNVDGRVQGIAQEVYQDLLYALIPPGEERQFRLRGLSIGGLPENSTVGLFLYDVATAIDAAGNVTQRDNFEWYFHVTLEQRTESFSGSRTNAVWLPQTVADELMADQSRGIYRCHGGG